MRGVLSWCLVFAACGVAEDFEAPESQTEAVQTFFGPDLVISGLSSSGSSVSVSVCNRGSYTARNVVVVAVLSRDAFISTSDFVIGRTNEFSLASQQCTTQSVNGAFAVSDGRYVLGAIVDPYDAIDETNETNNSAAGPVVNVSTRAELSISAGAVPTSSRANAAFTVPVTVCNSGGVTAMTTTVVLRLSTDDVITTADQNIGVASTPSIAAGACVRLDITTSLSAVRDRWLGATVSTVSPEGDLSDNAVLVGPFAVGSEAELTATLSSVAVTGSQISPSVRVCNAGFSSAPASLLKLFVSQDGALDASDLQLGNTSMPMLFPGACLEWRQTFSLPALTGSYKVLAQVDANDVVPELFENNNVAASSVLRLGADLVVTQAQSQSGFAVGVTVCNQGNAPAQPSVVGVLDSKNALAGKQTIGGLAVGQCWSATITVTPPLFFGSTRFTAIADFEQNVFETDEGNNQRSTNG